MSAGAGEGAGASAHAAPAAIAGDPAALAARRRATLQLCGAVAVLMVLGVVVDAVWPTAPEAAVRSSASPRGDGFLGLHDVLRRLGVDVGRHRASYAALPPPESTVLLALDPLDRDRLDAAGVRSDAAQVRALGTWVEAGGQLVVALPGRSVATAFGHVLHADDGPPQAGALPAPLAPLARATRKWGESIGAGSAAAVHVVEGPGDFRGRFPVPTAGDAAALLPWLHAPAVEPGDDAVAHAPGPRASAHTVAHMVLADSAANAETVATLDGEPFVRREPMGRGAVWVCASPYPFGNLPLARHGTAPFVAALLRAAGAGAAAAGGRTVVFDEYCHGLHESRGGWHWVHATSLGWPLLGLLLAGVLLAWRQGLRLGPPRPERLLPRRAKEEFVHSLAEIAHRAGRHRGAARRIVAAWSHRLRARRARGIATDAGDDLAAARDVAGGAAELAPFAARLERGEPRDDADLVRFVAELEQRLDERRE